MTPIINPNLLCLYSAEKVMALYNIEEKDVRRITLGWGKSKTDTADEDGKNSS